MFTDQQLVLAKREEFVKQKMILENLSALSNLYTFNAGLMKAQALKNAEDIRDTSMN